jgi:charged multivesicular body protein 1
MPEPRMTSKQLESLSKKAEKEEKKERAKVTKALKDRDMERGKIFAENAIRKKNESLNFLRMAARVDGVTSRLKSAQSVQAIAKQMGGVVKGLDNAMASMDLVALSGIMDKFESQFTDLDVRSSVMENAMSGAVAQSTPLDQIEALMKEVADENHLEVQTQLSGVAAPAEGAAVGDLTVDESTELSRRLAALRG